MTAPGTIRCEACEQAPAICRCEVCDLRLCEECRVQAHQTLCDECAAGGDDEALVLRPAREGKP